MKTLRVIFSALILLVLVPSCGSKKNEVYKVDPAYGQYIAGYSSGMMSRTNNFRVQLNDEVLKEFDRKDKEFVKEIFTIQPAIKGEVIWVNERTIEFVPTEMLPVNQFFNVEFDLDRVANVERKHRSFKFQCATYAQQIDVSITGVYNYSKYELDYKYIEGYIATTDDEDSLKLLQTLTVLYEGKAMKVKLKNKDLLNGYSFVVDSIKRPDSEKSIEVKWDGKAINSISKGSKSISLAPKGNFRIDMAQVFEEEDQYVEVQFSEPIADGQDLKGLIQLDGEDFNYDIEGNKVTLYLPKRLSGKRKLVAHKGIQNIRGHKMLKTMEETLVFDDPKPNVRVVGSGSILPNSQGLFFPFESIALKSIDVRVVRILENNIHHFLQVNDMDGYDELARFGKVVAEKKIRLDQGKKMNSKEWTRHVIDLNKLMKPHPGSIYRVSIKFSKEDAACDCPPDDDKSDDDYDEEEEVEKGNWNERLWRRHSLDDNYETWYYYNNSDENPCNRSYYYGKAISRNILGSDLGLIFKLDDDKTGHVFVNNMLTTAPIQGARVEFYTYAKELITAIQTDASGMAQIKLSEKPFMMVANYGNQKGYLKLRDGYVNSLSRFDVDGEFNPSGIKGYLYGERGVWRPGDSLYLCFMLGDRFKKLPPNHPVHFELQDPNGGVVYAVTKTTNVNNIYDFRAKTDQAAMTGNYTAVATVGNKSFYKSIKIETIKPNRLKIDFKTHPDGSADSAAYLNVRWLHGAKAANLRATVSVGFQTTTTTFTGLKNYCFDSPLRNFSSTVETVFDGKLDQNGNARPRARVHLDGESPGKLKATYVIKAFEESGDFSIDRFNDTYSPYKTYVGLRTPAMKDYDESLITDQRHNFDVVTVTENGVATDAQRVHVKIYKLKWHWWYESDEQDLFTQITQSGTIAVKDTILSTKKGKSSFQFKARHEDYGRYLITVTDLDGKHQTGRIVNFDWPYWNRGSRIEKEQAKMLSFSIDKPTYIKNEPIKLSFPSPESGRALVSVENGRKIIKKFWVETQKGETTCSFMATEEMSPAAYIHVTLIQAHGNTKNDLPIRMYGVIPVRVDNPESHLNPIIDVAAVIRPESTTSIKVKEKNGRKMTYTLAVVDEGLLDLTRFSTPQPWHTFNSREALGVKTWDMYDYVIGAYSGQLDNLLSVGGDGYEEPGSGPKANRFKPMVKFLGPFTLEANQQKSHKIDVPNYIGAVRVMVVAHNNNGAHGNASESVFVRKPLMLLTTLPRVLGPGEEFDLPVTVFAMEDHVKKVKIDLESNDLIEIIDQKSKELTFSEIGDQIVYFKVRVKKRMGIANFKVTASSGKEKALEEIEVDVRPSNPMVVDAQNHTVEKGGNLNLPFKLFGIQGSNQIVVEVSDLPSIGLEKRLNYLVNYPHGCLEQTTSAAFPQLYLAALLELSDKQKDEISRNVSGGLDRLRSFQTEDGGFAYWPGEIGENEWGTNYAGHFLIEAELAGFKIPNNLKERWVNFQQNKARNWSKSSSGKNGDNDELTQAYRLFTLALAKQPELGAMNRLRESGTLSNKVRWRLAAAYALAGQNDAAGRIVKGITYDVESYRELSGTFGSEFRDKAMILEALSIMNEHQKASKLVESMADVLRSDKWLSTQETAYSLLAVSSYSNKKGSDSGPKFSYKLEKGYRVELSGKKRVVRLEFKANELAQNKHLELTNQGNTRLYISYVSKGIPIEGDKTKKSNGMNMSLKYYDMKGEEIKIDKLKQGTEFKARVTLTNTHKTKNYKELALSHIFPSGWEIHNSRMDEINYNSTVRYQDFRDDRVNSYFNLGKNATLEIDVLLTASYTGKFYLPSVFVSAMYDDQINALIPGKWVEVVK
jgi:alpha-2-macroglobulin